MKLEEVDGAFREALDTALRKYRDLIEDDPQYGEIDWVPTYLISVFRTLIGLLESGSLDPIE